MNLTNIEGKFSSDPNGKFSVGENGMIATAFPDATEAGVEIFKKGGNAIDAACADLRSGMHA